MQQRCPTLKGRRQRGLATVELALILPVLVLLLSGVLQFGGMFFLQNKLVNVARDATRRLSVGEFTVTEAESFIAAQLVDWPYTISVDITMPDPNVPTDRDVTVEIGVPKSQASLMDILGMFQSGELVGRVTMRQEFLEEVRIADMLDTRQSRPTRRSHSSRHQAGSVLLIVTVMLLGLIAFGAMAVDGGHIFSIRTQCQVAADGAALAGALLLPDLDAARLAALDNASKNMVPGLHGDVVQGDDVEFGIWDFGSRIFTPSEDTEDINAVKVTAQRSAANGNPLPLTLARVVGVQSSEVRRSAVAAFGSPAAWDLVLVQDATGSFCEEIALAKQADHELLNCFAASAHPDSNFGVVTYTGFGFQHSPMVAVGDYYQLLYDSITAIQCCNGPGGPTCSGTNIGAGIEVAVNMLAASTSNPNTPQAIVLVTDGFPEPSTANPGWDKEQLDAFAVQAADMAKDAGITMFVVYYYEDDSSGQSDPDLLEGLAGENGTFLSTPDPEELPDLLTDICGSILPLRLVD